MARTKTSEAKIKFTADTHEYNEGLSKAGAATKELNNALKLADSELKIMAIILKAYGKNIVFYRKSFQLRRKKRNLSTRNSKKQLRFLAKILLKHRKIEQKS